MKNNDAYNSLLKAIFTETEIQKTVIIDDLAGGTDLNNNSTENDLLAYSIKCQCLQDFDLPILETLKKENLIFSTNLH